MIRIKGWNWIICIFFFSGGLIFGLLLNKLDIYVNQPFMEVEEKKSIVDIIKEEQSSVVIIESTYGGNHTRASGIILNDRGYIITNGHVIRKAKSIHVILKDGLKKKASLVHDDPKEDLAVLKLEEAGHLDLKPATFGDSDGVETGEVAIAIGNPLGEQLSCTVTVGVISGRNRWLKIDGKRMNLLQTDAAINAGNSGGPLLNDRGEVIGIITFHISSDKAQGIGFAIPSNRIKEVIEKVPNRPNPLKSSF